MFRQSAILGIAWELDLALGGECRATQGQQCTGNAACGVANDVFFAGEIAGDAAYTHGFDAVNVRLDGRCLLGGIASECLRREGRGIYKGVVKDWLAGVLVDALDVLGGAKSETFICLGHQVTDVHACSAGIGERRWNSLDKEIGDQRGVKGARPDGDEVSPLDGLECLGERRGVRRLDHQFGNAQAAGGNAGFTAHQRTVIHARYEGRVRGGDGIDVASGRKDLGRELDGLAKVPCNLGESGDKQVAEVMTFKSIAGLEAVCEALGADYAYTLGWDSRNGPVSVLTASF